MSRVGEILLAHGEAYRRLHGSRTTPDQLRAMRALAACHTPALGGVRWHCPRCGGAAFAYRSCGDRHCPACGHADAKLWLERQTRLLLPGVTYHLATFTVPDGLRCLVRSHPREALPLLFEASSSALLALCRDRRHVGGTPALTAVLHTVFFVVFVGIQGCIIFDAAFFNPNFGRCSSPCRNNNSDRNIQFLLQLTGKEIANSAG